MLDVKVQKKDGLITEWNDAKIRVAVGKSSARANRPMTEENYEELLEDIHSKVIASVKDVFTTLDIHEMVLSSLFKINRSVHHEYSAYRKYKAKYDEAFKRTAEQSYRIVNSGDNENANKDSTLNSTKHALIGETAMKEMMDTFELDPEWNKAVEDGYIWIHDRGSRFLKGINCDLFDMGSLIKNGFDLNGSKYFEPTTVQTVLAVIGDVTLSASAQQYGGFTISEFDSVVAPYAENTFDKYYDYYHVKKGLSAEMAEELADERTMREIEKGYIGFETKLNTISNSLGQIPFVTITFGMNTSKWARRISQTILKVRKGGMGENQMTAIFPKLVFVTRKEVNRMPDAPNYDIYKQAIDCSKTRLYPDYLSLDGENNNLREVYERSGKIVSPMGQQLVA